MFVAVHHAVDDVTALGVRGGCSVHSEQNNAQRAALKRDDVDVEVVVVLDALRQLAEVVAHALAVELALQDLAIASFARAIARGLSVVNCQGGAVEIAFEFEAGLANELFVFRLAILGRLLAQIGEQPDGFEVDVENGVRIGQEAGGIGRGALAKQQGGNDCADNENDGEGDPEVTPAISHG